jgi:hypothetical protein
LVPLRWNHAFFNGNAQVAALGLNPFVWIYDTARFSTNTATKEDLKPYFGTLSHLLGATFPSEEVGIRPLGHAYSTRGRRATTTT